MSLRQSCWQCRSNVFAVPDGGTPWCVNCRITNPTVMPESVRIAREVAAARRATVVWQEALHRADLAVYTYEGTVFLAHPDDHGNPIILLTDKGPLF
jgi:hypothetical protein